MLDSTLRPAKDRLFAVAARTPLRRLHPTVISSVGLAAGVAAALAAWQTKSILAVGLWLFGRLADGLDGAVARSTDRSSDTGGLVDFLFDTIGYAAIPLGLAFGLDERSVWIATAVLLASFYLNAVSLGYIAALLEKRASGVVARGQVTSVALPRGFVEGTETIVFFTLALAVPDAAATIWWLMTVAVLITVLERTRWAIGVLG